MAQNHIAYDRLQWFLELNFGWPNFGWPNWVGNTTETEFAVKSKAVNIKDKTRKGDN